MADVNPPEWGQKVARSIDTYMLLENWGKGWIEMETRRFGTVRTQTPGPRDFKEARAVAKTVEAQYPSLDAEVGSIDEWVFVRIDRESDCVET